MNWKSIITHPLYEINTNGEVRNIKTQKNLTYGY